MYMFYVSVVTGFALWWAIAWFGGILFAGVWPRLKSKIAKANCCMIAAIPMIFVGQMSVYCMCGHPLGLEDEAFSILQEEILTDCAYLSI